MWIVNIFHLVLLKWMLKCWTELFFFIFILVVWFWYSICSWIVYTARSVCDRLYQLLEKPENQITRNIGHLDIFRSLAHSLSLQNKNNDDTTMPQIRPLQNAYLLTNKQSINVKKEKKMKQRKKNDGHNTQKERRFKIRVQQFWVLNLKWQVDRCLIQSNGRRAEQFNNRMAQKKI